MQALQLKKFDLPSDIEDKIVQIFAGELPFEEVNEVVNYIDNLDQKNFQELLTEAFKIADEEDFPLNRSTADRKTMGIANWIGRTIKNIRFRFKRKGDVIVAEGDSWFEHLFIKDIIDHLISMVDCRIYTLAYGGDWIGNYLEHQHYITALLKHKPKVFMLSGGGNDLLGAGRLATLINKKEAVDITLNDNDKNFINAYTAEFGELIATKIVIGRKFLNKHFWAVRQVFLFQYLLIIKSIENQPELKNMKIIVQGYDFAIPDNEKNTLLKKTLGHGSWLYEPLISMDITNTYEQEAIVAAMLFDLNEILDYISKTKKNVYYVDCRGKSNRSDWNDELHLKSSVYKKIAQAFKRCIESDDPSKKRFKV